MKLEELNRLAPEPLSDALKRCCGSALWCVAMSACRPFKDEADLLEEADRIWWALEEQDWREAFEHHPRIGQDMASLREKFGSTADWASGEQAGAAGASEKILQALAEGNRLYEQRFDHIFIVCATGKSAREMLDLLQERIANDPDMELRLAAEEQSKITKLRLKKLLES